MKQKTYILLNYYYSVKIFQAFVAFGINVKWKNMVSAMTLGSSQFTTSWLLRSKRAEYGCLSATFVRQLFSHRKKITPESCVSMTLVAGNRHHLIPTEAKLYSNLSIWIRSPFTARFLSHLETCYKPKLIYQLLSVQLSLGVQAVTKLS